MHKRLSILFGTFLVSTMMILPVFASDADPPDGADTVFVSETVTYSQEAAEDNNDLFAGYVRRLFGLDQAAVFSTGTHTAGSTLSGDEKLAYDALVPIIKNIASGERISTEVAVGSQITDSNGIIHKVDAEVTYTEASSGFDYGVVFDALRTDFPYEMYWHDKTTASNIILWSSSSKLYLVEIQFQVADNYQGDDEFTVDTSKAQTAAEAVDNAIGIVHEFAALDDYSKLKAYNDRICELVTYDTAAAESGNFAQNDDPWQLVSVFDDDNDTNVVCEGYSKAFQYLCDMSTFKNDIQCYLATGTLLGGGGHMWNIVTMEDENNYIVDVTNSDSGTVGQNGGLFLAGAAKQTGTFGVTDSNGVSSQEELGFYAFTVGNTTVTFIYDIDTTALWGTDEGSILNLAETDYVYTPTIDFVDPTGDANCDGRTNSIDLIYFQRYLANWEGYLDGKVDVTVLDLNGDSKANADDAMYLARHIAKWIGYDSLPCGST